MSALDLDGLSDAQLRLFAVRCARRVQHLMTDPRSVAALDVAERYAKGEATDEELAAARAAARDAAWVAADAADAARAAADAARYAARAAAAAADAARYAAWAAADVADSADAAWYAAWAAADAADAADAAWAATRAEQQKILDEVREVKPCEQPVPTVKDSLTVRSRKRTRKKRLQDDGWKKTREICS